MKEKKVFKIFSGKKKYFITLPLIFLLLLVTIELLLSLFYPQDFIYPRLSYSEKYRKIPYKNCIIEHKKSNEIRFYTTNEYHLRGNLIPISNEYDKPNIILLGDSYTFGIGVNDGDEWASVLSNSLYGKFNVINTGVGGWGLTQEIRRYYEFGQLYYPHSVIILFSGGDPYDNLKDYCTTIENNKFVFHDFSKKDNWIYVLGKKLSNSRIQKSSLFRVLSSIIWEIIYL